MFYIIGISHRAQIKEKGAAETEQQKEFRSCLEQTVEQFKPTVIAEELSDYALEKLSREKGSEQESLTFVIAGAAKVEHRFCDPDENARRKIGYIEGSTLVFQIAMADTENLSNAEVNRRGYAIEAGNYWPLREKFWLDQLVDVQGREVIFVCGDAHIESFQELLKKNGIDSTIVKRHIGLTQYDDDFFGGVRAYLAEHPELLR